MDLAEAVLSGNRLALSRLLTQVENDTPEGRAALDALFPHTGRAHLVGVTGSPGTGKSSLVNQLARILRRSELAGRSIRRQDDSGALPRVAIVAVDPSSPFTGGALLGDRVRMRDLSGDPDVFIRSMASRGALGGLARSTAGVTQVLDAAGFDLILIETVGAGQAEVDIARLAHTTVVVEAPGMGDDIQAIKAGILEIADILVVNKADRPGVESTERALRAMLELAEPGRKTPGKPGWQIPVLRTIANNGEGAERLVEVVLSHARHLHETGGWQERELARMEDHLRRLIQVGLVERWQAHTPEERYTQALQSVLERRLSPFEAAARLIEGAG
jgi:LAO/AO transport system kinase